ncbi:EsaB/YukD family protein [Streptomyces hoynatensis]|uniref:Type VII secretion integral membrane protein EccD n=1 Tax=Streptomyces hoynatensis TaxID=1141874 RepID=A0A3A9Z3L3_9ACTN|nr:EsaB/YukD family protein [Streptomyces hoynatensis]RKN43031.1 type VII secretion integral membrane protein EccD [Streptomyces hoynatensis]
MSGSLTHRPATQAGATFVRIGLAGPAGRADLAVPAGVPLARLMPALLRHAGEEPGPDGGVGHGGWVLRRADGTRLDTAAPLAAQGVGEGDLLFVGRGSDDTTPPLYDDVVEVMGREIRGDLRGDVRRDLRGDFRGDFRGENSAGTAGAAGGAGGGGGRGSAGGGLPAAAVRGATGALATLAVLAACAALDAAPGALPGWLGLATAVCALSFGLLLSRAFGDTRAGVLASVLAAPPAMLGAVRLLGGGTGILGGATAGQLLLACGVLALIGAVGPLLADGGDGAFAALVTAGPLTATGALVCAVWDVAPARAAAIAAPLALALTTLWPTVAVRLAGIPGPQVAATVEELDALPSQLAYDRLRARIAAARRLLLGMQAGSHLVAGGGAVVLFGSGRLWPGVLGAALTLLMLTRTRLFAGPAQAAVPLTCALLAAGGAAAAYVTGRFGETVPMLGVALPGALLIALAAGLVGLFTGRTRLNPRLSRAIDLLEGTLLLSVVPLCLAVWEVYPALLDLRA